MEYSNIDKVIAEFYSYLPLGNNYYDSVHGFHFEFKENEEIKKFLIDEGILIDWGDQGKHILSKKGIEIIETHKSILTFLTNEKQILKQKNEIENAKNQSIIYNAKLSKWKVKTFWFAFFFGIIGGVYSIYSIINSIFKEPDEKRIERIIDQKLQSKRIQDFNTKKSLIKDTLNLKK